MKRNQQRTRAVDHLVPLESLDLDRVTNFCDLLRAMAKTAFSGRQLGEAFDILLEISRRSDCHLVMTVSGAMTVARQGRIMCQMIDRGLVQTVVATGALIAHGLTESIGGTHFRHDPRMTDQTLFECGYNRVYDTLEMESNLDDVAALVRDVLDQHVPSDGVWSSAELCRALGKRLSELDQGPGILRSAYEHHVPVFVPALTDSELGLDIATWAMSKSLRSTPDTAACAAEEIFQAVPDFNPFLDLQAYARRVAPADCLALFTIGGGVPRNWAQQIGPYYEITSQRLGRPLTPPRFKYAVRICPEPVHWGGLSGCTYSEGVSWGKFVPPEEGGRFAEIYADATLVWPLLIKAVFEQLDAESGQDKL